MKNKVLKKNIWFRIRMNSFHINLKEKKANLT